MVLSVDLGGSHIACAVVLDGAVLRESHWPTQAHSLAAELPAIAAGLRRCLAQADGSASQLLGVAFGFCGIVDGRTGEVLSTLDKYRDAGAVDLAGWAKCEFGLPVRVENDACLALLGEASAGAARGTQDVVMVTLGTGIGGAAMLGGRLLRSRAGHAGCLGGHLPVKLNGRRCGCGAAGCAEAEASTVVLPLLCREHPDFAASLLASERVLNFETLFRAAEAQDGVARDVLAHCLRVWSVLTVGLIHAYGPELVLFGGGVLRRGEAVLAPIRAYVAEHMWRTSRGLPRIQAAALGERAALLGGASLFGPRDHAVYEEAQAKHVEL